MNNELERIYLLANENKRLKKDKQKMEIYEKVYDVVVSLLMSETYYFLNGMKLSSFPENIIKCLTECIENSENQLSDIEKETE